jgi:hypothetical protein
LNETNTTAYFAASVIEKTPYAKNTPAYFATESVTTLTNEKD